MEVSPHLCDLQSKNLCLTSQAIQSESTLCYRKGVTALGIPISWYNRIEDVPREFSLVVAHEFFDALPIHKFQVSLVD